MPVRWKTDPNFNEESSLGVPYLDAEVTAWNLRDKKIAGQPMSFLRKEKFKFSAGKQHFIPIYEQSRYKYILYVEGHCAANRYAFLMRLGSVILKVCIYVRNNQKDIFNEYYLGVLTMRC